MLSKGCWEGKKGLEANYILYVYLWHIFMYWFYDSLSQRLVSVMSHLSQELEENKRLPGIQLAADRTKTHMMPRYLQPSRCPASLVLPRHVLQTPPPQPDTLNLLCGSLDWPPPPLLSTSLISLLFPAPSGRPRPSLATPATITRQHSRLPLPAPGAVPACQPPGSTGRVWTTENVAQTRRQLASRRTAAVPNCLPISFRWLKKSRKNNI